MGVKTWKTDQAFVDSCADKRDVDRPNYCSFQCAELDKISTEMLLICKRFTEKIMEIKQSWSDHTVESDAVFRDEMNFLISNTSVPLFISIWADAMRELEAADRINILKPVVAQLHPLDLP